MKYQTSRSAPGTVMPAPPTGRLPAADATKSPFHSLRREPLSPVPVTGNCTQRPLHIRALIDASRAISPSHPRRWFARSPRHGSSRPDRPPSFDSNWISSIVIPRSTAFSMS